MMLKKFAFALLLSTGMLQAQDEIKVQNTDIKVGDVLELGAPKTMNYKYIDFPRANFIMKRGGIANYKALMGDKVVVSAIEKDKNGAAKIKIKREDGSRFFRSYAVVYADIDNALSSGELVVN